MCNPEKCKGERKLFCSKYNECLDIVVKNQWESWNCLHCDYDDFEIDLENENIEGYEVSLDYVSMDYLVTGFDYGFSDSDYPDYYTL
jgi:hypothetical protein